MSINEEEKEEKNNFGELRFCSPFLFCTLENNQIGEQMQSRAQQFVSRTHQFEEACIDAIDRVLLLLKSVPEKLVFFCSLNAFYEELKPDPFHKEFQTRVLLGTTNISQWNILQINDIQTLLRTYAAKKVDTPLLLRLYSTYN